MNDCSDNPDELVSAVIDGEASDADQARVASDRELSERREQLAAAAAALGGPVDSPTASARDAAIAAALAAFDEGQARPDPEAAPAPVIALRGRRPLRWLGVAAAAAIAVVAGAVLLRGGGSSSSTTAARDDTRANSSASAQDTSARAPGAADQAEGTSAASAAFDLGSFGTADALVAAVRGTLDVDQEGAAPTTVAPTDAPPTDATRAIDDQPATPACPAPRAVPVPKLVVSAVLAGQPVIVFVGPDPSGATVLVALTTACTVLLQQPLP
ncbi:MAG: hypothetical protein ABIV94_11990 [Acidimicrobiales bacterium]